MDPWESAAAARTAQSPYYVDTASVAPPANPPVEPWVPYSPPSPEPLPWASEPPQVNDAAPVFANHHQTPSGYYGASPQSVTTGPVAATRAAVLAPDRPVMVPAPVEDYWPQPEDDDVSHFYDDVYVTDDSHGETESESGVGGFFDSPEPAKSHGVRSAVIIVLVLAIIATLGYIGYTKGMALLNARPSAAADYPGPGEDDITVTIPQGAGSRTIGTILFNADVVQSVQAFVNAANADTTTFSKVSYGVHQLQTKMSAASALDALADPAKLVTKQVTVIEGLTYQQAFKAISDATGISADDLQAQADDPSGLGLPDWADNKIEGFLFPDSYGYDTTTTAQGMLKKMVGQFKSVIADLDFVNKAQAEGLTPYQALVLASIIQKEGADDPEYAQDIAQVFMNRLTKNMPLQSDATVAYAVGGANGKVTTTNADRATDSPYNTYKYAGLPPGPISSPGR
ncbi:MAG: endolytic transglycosylase MltG, partial [Propionibacteriaceae bacterium]|nr:endolytic transglycosylase MltG [Propionibacteriaceae bacterium]